MEYDDFVLCSYLTPTFKCCVKTISLKLFDCLAFEFNVMLSCMENKGSMYLFFSK